MVNINNGSNDVNHNTKNNTSFKDYLENLITNNKDNNKNKKDNKNKTILGRLRVKKKIIERNKYKNIDGFVIHIANKSENKDEPMEVYFQLVVYRSSEVCRSETKLNEGNLFDRKY